MEPTMIAQVRRFNRIVTQRVGALDDRFLASNHPLGEARVLWEIGPNGRDVRSLRAQLGLDSGYLSRLLHSLEAAKLIAIGPDPSDRRRRVARLTAPGLAERAVLDRRSDHLAESLLAPLTDGQRARLVAAMADVERLMMASMVVVAPVDPAEPAAQHCLNAYYAELNRRFDTGFDPARSLPMVEHEIRPPEGLFLIATLHGSPIGCGALRFHGDQPTEVKRMWVDESARGLGVGRRLLHELETRAAAHGSSVLHIETNGTLTEAINLYRSAGWVEVAPFNDEAYAHHWFEKHIPADLPTSAQAPAARRLPR
jgi:DNA-binding MarR family transcriptional regulator/ribosomal protein S18 acetylase RimI-like enzyme